MKPRVFTASEQVIDFLANQIITDGRTYKQIAASVGVSQTTIYMIASRNTRWPRPTTLFPLLAEFGAQITITIGRR